MVTYSLSGRKCFMKKNLSAEIQEGKGSPGGNGPLKNTTVQMASCEKHGRKSRESNFQGTPKRENVLLL